MLVQSDQGVTLARLLMLLECGGSNEAHRPQLALVLYFDPVYRPISALERATGFRRFRQRPRRSAELISVDSIIRGALLVPTLESSLTDDFLANDLVDADMYIRFMLYSSKNLFH